MVNFLALGSYNSLIKSNWMLGGTHYDWARDGMWRDDLLTDEEEDECLRTARDWEERHK